MIITEIIKINGKDFYKSYSDEGYKIYGGSPESYYDEAIDPFERTYVESGIPIDDASTAEEIVNILTGGVE